MSASLYVHVPFCASRCEYCAFYSEGLRADLVARYTDALCEELRAVADRQTPFRTIFFGGGTPSILPIRSWETILQTFHDLRLVGAEEWTVECNPATVSMDKASLLKQGGVTRISMGVQSLDASLLDRLGRIHSREQVFRSYDTLREAGFERINLDFMFGIPSQTLAIWEDTLREARAMGSEHLSCYEVIYEEDTPLFEQLHAGAFAVDEDLIETMYQTLCRTAEEAGFHQYEIANFARHTLPTPLDPYPSEASLHNLNYWQGGDCYACGPSAVENIGARRSRHWANTQMYCDLEEAGQRGLESTEELSPRARAGEIAAFALRMNAGIGLEEFRGRTGFGLIEDWGDAIESLEAKGWATRTETRFHLTRQGLRFADAAGAEFLVMDDDRDDMR